MPILPPFLNFLLLRPPAGAIIPKMSSEAKLIVEYAKSGRASCKTCSTAIASGAPRLGLVTPDSRGFDMTKWHHLQCLPLNSTSPESITGFSSLKSDDQEELKKLIESSEKVLDGDNESKNKAERKSKVRETDEDSEDHGAGKSAAKKIKASESADEDEPDITMSPSDNEGDLPTPKISSDTKLIVEYAKSGRSTCKKCSTAIAPGAPRLGLVTHNFRGYDMTKWHHLQCLPLSFDVATSPDSISGFSSLKSDDQEELKKLIEASEKVCETDVDPEGHSAGESAAKKIKSSEPVEEGELEITMSPSDIKDSDLPAASALIPKKTPTAKLIVEYAKSGRSSCKKCSTNIASGAPRLGLVTPDSRGFDMTKWHHLQCLPLNDVATSPDSIDGFSSLKSDDQDELKKLIESSVPTA